MRKTVEILMMVKRIATGPVDEINIGIDMLRAVKRIGCARLLEHVGEARNRDGGTSRIRPRVIFR